MTLYRVSILDHPHVDWLVNVCGNGACWAFERYSICQFFERRRPRLRDAKFGGRVTGRGFFVPVHAAGTLGYRLELSELTVEWIKSSPSKGVAGRRAERAFAEHVKRGVFAPYFLEYIRDANEHEDKVLGIDMFCVTSVAERSGVQVKWDSPAEESGNLWVQVETEPVTSDWTSDKCARREPE